MRVHKVLDDFHDAADGDDFDRCLNLFSPPSAQDTQDQEARPECKEVNPAMRYIGEVPELRRVTLTRVQSDFRAPRQ